MERISSRENHRRKMVNIVVSAVGSNKVAIKTKDERNNLLKRATSSC